MRSDFALFLRSIWFFFSRLLIDSFLLTASVHIFASGKFRISYMSALERFSALMSAILDGNFIGLNKNDIALAVVAAMVFMWMYWVSRMV